MELRSTTDGEAVSAGSWTDAGLVLSMRGSVWLIPVSPKTGKVDGTPRQITSGAGLYQHPAVSRDGQLVFNVTNPTGNVERVSLTNPTSPPAILFSQNSLGASRPSQTLDGVMMAYIQSTSQGAQVWLRNTRSGDQHMVVQVDHKTAPLGLSPVLSPDAAHIAYTIERQPDIGTGYIVDAAGGVPRQICQDCGVHGFLSDNRRLVAVMKEYREIAVVDSTTGEIQPVLETTDGKLDRPHPSVDDRWLAVRDVVGTDAKVLVGALSPGHPEPLSHWSVVQQPTTTPRPAGWSPDGRILYLLLDTDGFRCLWGQRIDPQTGRFVGTPYAVRHFHSTIQQQFSNSYGNAFTSDTFLYGGSRDSGNLWRLAQGSALSGR